MRGEERRNITTRAAVVQRVINGVVQNPSVTLTVDTLQMWLNIPLDAAQRILERLASSGLVPGDCGAARSTQARQGQPRAGLTGVNVFTVFAPCVSVAPWLRVKSVPSVPSATSSHPAEPATQLRLTSR